MARRARTAEDGQGQDSPQHEELAADGLHEMPQPVLTSTVGGASGAPIQERSRIEPKAVAVHVAGEGPRRFRVANPKPARVVYDGAPVTINPGKIVDDRTYSIDHLRRQGVLLDELPEAG